MVRLWINRGLALIDRTNIVLWSLVATLIVVMAIAISLNVIARVFGWYFLGVLELTRFALLWITFCGSAWLLRQNGHITVNFVTIRLGAKSTAILDMITGIISLFGFALITWYGTKITIFYFQTDFIISESLLGLPKAPIVAIIPLGSLLLVIELLRKIISQLKGWKH